MAKLMVNFQADEEEKALWKAIAEAEGRSLSNWIRKVLNNAAKEAQNQ